MERLLFLMVQILQSREEIWCNALYRNNVKMYKLFGLNLFVMTQKLFKVISD